ncbi:MAG: T9SS type A sorting domain-containing protein [Ignavibacteriaceae bacterium]|nr:T9SS type A sorting domain-containing protein [Ignavibacteriaceae bacterium]
MRKQYFFILLITMLLGSWQGIYSQANSQSDSDPKYDYLPLNFFKNLTPFNMAAQVITVNGFDNFYIGVDFAEPHMSVNPMNPRQFFNAFNTNGGHYTLDGWNWSNITPNFGNTMRGDPVLAHDSLGRAYYSNMYGASSIVGSLVMRSDDGGVTWTNSAVGVTGVDKNWIAADQTSGPYANYVYNTMTGGSSQGRFWRSTDRGTTYAQTATFSNQVLPGMMVCVGPHNNNGTDIPGGSVYVVTHSGTNSAGVYNFYRSTDGGVNFTAMSSQSFSNYIGTEVGGRSTVSAMRTRPYPMIAADNSYGPNRGKLYLVYASNNPSGNGNKSDIFFRSSTDGGTTWSAAKVVNDDPNPQNNHSFFPAIWCDKNTGRLYIKWYDTRLVPTSDSMDVYATYTDDGGATFAPNQRITNKTFKIKIAGTGTGPYYQGDYDAVSGINNQSMLVWTDFRFNGYGSFVGYFPDYAFIVSPENGVVQSNGDSVQVNVSIPEVKLYDSSVKLTWEVNPVPLTGSFNVTFTTDSITSYPAASVMKIRPQNVEPGNYTFTVTGAGPYGIPVHKRTYSLQVNAAIPVELTSFEAVNNNGKVVLSWSTGTETNNSGFSVERSTNGQNWNQISFVEGKGTTTERQSYRFEDNSLTATGTFLYRLKQIDFDGTYEYSNVISVEVENPTTFAVEQNYPNPFNPSTKISYSLASASNVKLIIYDALGKVVDELAAGIMEAGIHSFEWKGTGFSSGTYFYSFEAVPQNGDQPVRMVRKMLLMK